MSLYTAALKHLQLAFCSAHFPVSVILQKLIKIQRLDMN